MTKLPESRPRTLWFGNYTSITPAVVSSVAAREDSAQNDSPKTLPFCACHELDPWSVYEPRAHVPGRQVTLAQHGVNKQGIVNVQRLRIDRSQVQHLLETVSQLSHNNFLRLLESYYNKNQLFLVWEPVELSVADIVSAQWPINESELAGIVWSTLEGIRFLRDKGVRVAGVEHSCQLQPSEMNAHTLKLTAVAAIMSRLMAKTPGGNGWSSQAQDFLRDLTVKPLDKLMQEPFLAKRAEEGDLKLCVYIANKTVDHNLRSYTANGVHDGL
ncbi:phosphorylase b kinase gamma catalytic chain, testis/liver isoform [Aspergillus udagawae]|nr:phosphorylase b kinase gamma catalytic chain, testis/liver isoform [Aspergillus udagawae]